MFNRLKNIFKSKNEVVTVYVLRADAEITARDVAELFGYCNSAMPLIYNVVLPDFPCITQRQFDRLPERLQNFYDPRLFELVYSPKS